MPEGEMNAVSMKIPPFWPQDPELWFLQVDAQFSAKNITVSKTKFQHVVGAIATEVAVLVRDIISAPPDDDPYKLLRETLIERTGPTKNQLLREVLRPQSIGDRRPSIMLQSMKHELGQETGDILRELFLKRLPSEISLTLSAFSNDTVDELAKKADRMIDAAPKSFPASNSVDEFNAVTNPDWCWYHNKYGPKARACRSPCSYKKPSEN